MERRQGADRRKGDPDDRAEGGAELLLLVKLLREDAELTGALRRLSRQLRLCAEIPQLAGLEPEDGDSVDPDLLRKAASLLTAEAAG